MRRADLVRPWTRLLVRRTTSFVACPGCSYQRVLVPQLPDEAAGTTSSLPDGRTVSPPFQAWPQLVSHDAGHGESYGCLWSFCFAAPAHFEQTLMFGRNCCSFGSDSGFRHRSRERILRPMSAPLKGQLTGQMTAATWLYPDIRCFRNAPS
jgi:hypothetical protein